jgi:hypothetical protein
VLGRGPCPVVAVLSRVKAELAVEGDAVWVANALDSTVSRLGANTGSLEATHPRRKRTDRDRRARQLRMGLSTEIL